MTTYHHPNKIMRAVVAIVALALCVAFCSARIYPRDKLPFPTGTGPYNPIPDYRPWSDLSIRYPTPTRPTLPFPTGTGPYAPYPKDREIFMEDAEDSIEIPEEIAAAVEELEVALERLKIHGKAQNGGRWEAGFEYTWASDDEEISREEAQENVISALDNLEELLEQYSINGNIGSNGVSVGGGYTSPSGNFNVGGGVTYGGGNNWGANVGLRWRF